MLLTNILVIHVSGRIGDTLLITPMLQNIKQYYPTANITILAHRNTAHLLKNNPYIYKVAILSKRKSYRRGWLFRKKYDMAFVVSGPKEYCDAFIKYAYRVSKKVVAFEAKNKLLEQCIDYTVKKNYTDGRHIVDYFHDLATAVGISYTNKRISFVATEVELTEAERLLQSSMPQNCYPIIGIKITSLASRSYRDWSSQYLLELASSIVKKYPKSGFILFGGLGECASNQSMAKQLPTPVLDLSGKCLRSIGAMMSYLHLYIGVDTGVSHLMSTYDIPMIILYHPYNSPSKACPINHPNFYALECQQKFNDGIEINNLMSTITPNQVLEKVTIALNTNDVSLK